MKMNIKFLIIFLWLLITLNNEVFSQTTSEEKLWKKTVFSLKDGLRNPSKTRSLYIEDTSLTTLPFEIRTLKKLELLKIAKTLITEIPINACNLNNLRFLYLESNNKLNVENVFQSLYSSNISKISITKSKLEFLPKNIGRFVNLIELYLYDNNLKVLPNEIGDLKNLEILLLADNELNHLPYSMTNLKRLNTLSLNGNSFIELPQLLPELSSLSTIFVGNAELDIQQMFKLLGKCKSLEIIHLSEMEFSRINDFQELVDLPNLVNLILQDLFLEFDEIPLEKLSSLNVKVTIITNIEFNNDQLNTIAHHPNIKIEGAR